MKVAIFWKNKLNPSNSFIKQYGWQLRNIISSFIIINTFSFLYFFGSSILEENINLCFFNNLLGIECLGCGMGKGLIYLLRGNIQAATQNNLMVFPFTIGVSITLIWLLVDLMQNKDRYSIFVQSLFNKKFLFLFFIILIINWYSKFN